MLLRPQWEERALPNTKEVRLVKCPVCLHVPCEVLNVGSDPNIQIAGVQTRDRPKLHAKCPRCGAEFHLTDMTV
jgi:hypothetical protein